MSPVLAALEVVGRDVGAGDLAGFLDIGLLGIAWLLAALPPELTVAELAELLREEHP